MRNKLICFLFGHKREFTTEIYFCPDYNEQKQTAECERCGKIVEGKEYDKYFYGL